MPICEKCKEDFWREQEKTRQAVDAKIEAERKAAVARDTLAEWKSEIEAATARAQKAEAATEKLRVEFAKTCAELSKLLRKSEGQSREIAEKVERIKGALK